MKILILGTSNSLLKAGWVAGLIAALPEASVDRRGVGGVPATQFICEAGEDFARFDAVIMDTLPNDELLCAKLDEGDRLSRIALDLCATIAAQTRLIYLGVSEITFVAAQSPLRDAWADSVRRCGGDYIDVNALLSTQGAAYIDPGTDLYETHTHPQQELAWAIGHSLGLALAAQPAAARPPVPSRAACFGMVDATSLSHAGQVVNRRNSLFDIDFVALAAGQSLYLPRLWPDAPNTIIGFHISRTESSAVLRFTGGARSIDVPYLNESPAEQFTIGFLLVPQGTVADTISVLSGRLLLSRLAFWRGETLPFSPAIPRGHDPLALHRLVEARLTQRVAERQAARLALAKGLAVPEVMTCAPLDPGLLRCIWRPRMESLEFAQALPPLRRYTELVPTDPTGFIALAQCLRKSDAHADALAALDRAERYRPRNDSVVRERAQLLRDLGRDDEALAICREQILFQPLSADAWVLLGQALLREGDRPGGIAALERAVALRPDRRGPLLSLAELADEDGHHAQAAAWLRRCLALGPADVKLLFRLGRNLATAGDHRGAVAALRGALALNPNLGAAQFLLEQSIAAGGDLPEPVPVPAVAEIPSDAPHETPPPQSSWLGRTLALFRSGRA
jgi:tetratricopeptide (TPR) repeat protein